MKFRPSLTAGLFGLLLIFASVGVHAPGLEAGAPAPRDVSGGYLPGLHRNIERLKQTAFYATLESDIKRLDRLHLKEEALLAEIRLIEHYMSDFRDIEQHDAALDVYYWLPDEFGSLLFWANLHQARAERLMVAGQPGDLMWIEPPWFVYKPLRYARFNPYVSHKSASRPKAGILLTALRESRCPRSLFSGVRFMMRPFKNTEAQADATEFWGLNFLTFYGYMSYGIVFHELGHAVDRRVDGTPIFGFGNERQQEYWKLRETTPIRKKSPFANVTEQFAEDFRVLCGGPKSNYRHKGNLVPVWGDIRDYPEKEKAVHGFLKRRFAELKVDSGIRKTQEAMQRLLPPWLDVVRTRSIPLRPVEYGGPVFFALHRLARAKSGYMQHEFVRGGELPSGAKSFELGDLTPGSYQITLAGSEQRAKENPHGARRVGAPPEATASWKFLFIPEG